jgi:hypothetical protein
MLKNALFRDVLIALVLTGVITGALFFRPDFVSKPSVGAGASGSSPSSIESRNLVAGAVGYDNPAVRSTLDLPWAKGRL